MYLLALAESIQLFPDGTIFIHIALILLMIWVLNRTFFRPVNRIIESREQNKGGAGSEAEKILSEAAAKQSKFDQAMLAARSEGYELIEKQRVAAVAARQEKVAAAKAETSELLASEKKELQDQTETARATIASEADAMAEKISENILRA